MRYGWNDEPAFMRDPEFLKDVPGRELDESRADDKYVERCFEAEEERLP